VEDDWQVVWSPTTLAPELADGEQLELMTQAPDRGDVIGADGEVLMTERPVFRIGVDKTKVRAAKAPAAARELAGLIDIDAGGFAQEVRAAGDEAFVEGIVMRATDVGEPLRNAIQEVRGAVLLPDELALARTREFARALLGTVGEATAEM